MPVKTLVVYQHLPHYRLGVFKALEQDDRLACAFAAGASSHDGSIPTIDFDRLARVHALENHWFRRFLWQSGLLKALRRDRPEVVVFLGDFAFVSTWVAAALMRLCGVGVLFWTIGWHKPESGLRRRARLAFYRLSHGLLLYGETGQAIGTQMGFPRPRTAVVYNSSSSSLHDVTSSEAEHARFVSMLPPPGTEVITAVLRLNPVKRLDLLVHVAARLAERGRPVSVLIVGDGPEREHLSALARRLGVALHLPGAAYSAQTLQATYDRTSVTVIPAAAGLSVLQSLDHGRPVVTHDDAYGQMPEFEAIRPGVNGSLYRRDDVDAMADEITVWLDRSASKRSETGRACRESLARDWCPEAQAAKIGAEVVRLATSLGRTAA